MLQNNLILVILLTLSLSLTSCGEVRQQETQETQETQEIIIPESREVPLLPTKICPEWEGVWEYMTPLGVMRWEGNGYNYPPQELKDSAKIVKVW